MPTVSAATMTGSSTNLPKETMGTDLPAKVPQKRRGSGGTVCTKATIGSASVFSHNTVSTFNTSSSSGSLVSNNSADKRPKVVRRPSKRRVNLPPGATKTVVLAAAADGINQHNNENGDNEGKKSNHRSHGKNNRGDTAGAGGATSGNNNHNQTSRNDNVEDKDYNDDYNDNYNDNHDDDNNDDYNDNNHGGNTHSRISTDHNKTFDNKDDSSCNDAAATKSVGKKTGRPRVGTDDERMATTSKQETARSSKTTGSAGRSRSQRQRGDSYETLEAMIRKKNDRTQDQTSKKTRKDEKHDDTKDSASRGSRKSHREREHRQTSRTDQHRHRSIRKERAETTKTVSSSSSTGRRPRRRHSSRQLGASSPSVSSMKSRRYRDETGSTMRSLSPTQRRRGSNRSGKMQGDTMPSSSRTLTEPSDKEGTSKRRTARPRRKSYGAPSTSSSSSTGRGSEFRDGTTSNYSSKGTSESKRKNRKHESERSRSDRRHHPHHHSSRHKSQQHQARSIDSGHGRDYDSDSSLSVGDILGMIPGKHNQSEAKDQNRQHRSQGRRSESSEIDRLHHSDGALFGHEGMDRMGNSDDGTNYMGSSRSVKHAKTRTNTSTSSKPRSSGIVSRTRSNSLHRSRSNTTFQQHVTSASRAQQQYSAGTQINGNSSFQQGQQPILASMGDQQIVLHPITPEQLLMGIQVGLPIPPTNLPHRMHQPHTPSASTYHPPRSRTPPPRLQMLNLSAPHVQQPQYR